MILSVILSNHGGRKLIMGKQERKVGGGCFKRGFALNESKLLDGNITSISNDYSFCVFVRHSIIFGQDPCG